MRNVDPELASLCAADLTKVAEDLKSFGIDAQYIIMKHFQTYIGALNRLVIEQQKEISLFHLFEKHVDAGKVSEELWTDIKQELLRLRNQSA